MRDSPDRVVRKALTAGLKVKYDFFLNKNVFTRLCLRFLKLKPEQIHEKNPDFLFLACENVLEHTIKGREKCAGTEKKGISFFLLLSIPPPPLVSFPTLHNIS